MPPPDDNFGGSVDPGSHENVGAFGSDYDSSDMAWFDPPDYRAGAQTIGELKPLVMNQQPAHISALSDQFVRGISLLLELERNIRTHTQTLFNEAWTVSDARDEFMQRGPGRILAYVQDWQISLDQNRAALRSLIGPVQDSQSEMEELWARYEREVAEAGKPSYWDNVAAAFSGRDPGAPARQAEMLADRVEAKKAEFDRLARELVARLADAYSGAFFKMYSGVGAPYPVPNVIMAMPGEQWPPIPPGLGGGAPNLAGVPGGPNVAAPPPPPAVNAADLQRLANQTPNLAPPPGAVPPGAAPSLAPVPGGAGGPAVTVPPPPGAAGLNQPALPPPPPGMGLSGASARNAPAGLTAPRLAQVPGLGAGIPAPGGAGALPPPPPGMSGGLARGVLRNPGSLPGGAPGVLPPPGAGLGRRGTLGREATVRSPAANYTGTPGAPGGLGGAPGAPGGALPPPGATLGRRQTGTPGMPVTRSSGVGSPPAFSQSSMPPPVAPVLGRQSRRGQPGQPGISSPGGMRGAFAAPNATPPVLDATSARSAGSSLTPPPPAGIAPQRSQRGRTGPAGFPGGPGSGMHSPGGGMHSAGSGMRSPGGGTPIPPGGFPPGRRTAGRYTGQPAPNLVGNPDWLAETGPDEASSTAPVLRNQMAANPETGALPPGSVMPPPPGANAPVVGRPRTAARQAPDNARSRPAGPSYSRTAAFEAELARRAREADHRRRRTADAQEARPGEEEAFTVQTPGGPVVGSTPARPEEAPKPTIGNG